ncbi:MAG: putative Ig domain-containing protein [Synergistaceae bacterium]|nr:putative Ig domain-containing protein [Synergistaceae bacterium]
MRKKFMCAALLIFMMMLAAAPALAEGGHTPIPVDLSHLANNLPNERAGSNLLKTNVGDGDIPSTYDLRSVGGKSYVTSVKRQSPYNTCWAFAAIGAMESNALMRGGSALDLSEQHLAWFTFRNSDKSKAFKNMNSATFKNVMDSGGNSFYPTALYARLAGPVLEDSANLPYGTQPTKATPEEYSRALRLREVYYLQFGAYNVNQSEAARNIVKRRIMDSGAVVANYHNLESEYYQTTSGGTAFYYNGTGAGTINHAVLIVGWDDNYSKDNFKTKPASDGAWLIKNSWGSQWSNGTTNVGDEGYFWMSYEQYLDEGSAYITEEANEDMKVYCYDALGWTATTSYSGVSSVYSANVFKSEREGEVLTEVGFYTPDNNVTYEVNVYTGFTSMPASPNTGESKSTASGTIPFAGYHTVELDTPVSLTNGEYFAVVLKLSGNQIPVENKNSDGSFSTNAAFEEGSFISANGTSWTATSDKNACIKAFTLKDTAANIAPKITSTTPPDAVVSVDYYFKVSASGSRPLTWSMSGELPSGITFNTSTGEITGTATEVTHGGKNYTITATNTTGSDSQNYVMNVIEMPTISTDEFSGYVGYAFTGNLALSAGTASSWKLTTGKLPKGLSLNESTGAITGKPKAAGTTTVPITASTAAGNVSANVKFYIEAKPTKPKISTSKLPDGQINQAYSQRIIATGTAPVTLTIEGQPNGLTMNASGDVSGTPTAAGTFTMKVTASNIYTELNETTITKNVKLTIKAELPVIADPASSDMTAVVGEEFDGYSFTCSAGTAPFEWSSSGLPNGLTLNKSGDLEGTPTRAGDYNMTIKAANGAGKVQKRVVFKVFEKPSVTTKKLSDATTGKSYSAKLTADGTGPISWDIPELPDTLKITTAKNGTQATISGTPTAAAELTLNIKVSNDVGVSTKALTLKIKGVAPKLKTTLAKGKVDTEYSGATISATGTLPITITCSIPEASQTKFGITSLSDLGLSLSADAATGTATITGTPTKSVKNLPIVFSASNSVSTTPATKKANLTISGTRPSFTDSIAANIERAAGSSVTLDFTVTGTKAITFTLNKMEGWTVTPDGDYGAKVTGTAPDKAGKKLTIKVTAANADGKVTKTVKLKTTAATSPDVTQNSDPDPDLGEEPDETAAQPTVKAAPKDSGEAVLNLGAERGVSSIKAVDANSLKEYTIAAVLPEITVTESGLYDLEVDLDEGIEPGRKLLWFAFAQNREKTDDDEIAEFYDSDGEEITETPEEPKILISVWLNSGDIYEPVIAVE